MARNMNMLGAQVYIPNGRREQEEEPRRSPISGFGANTETGRMTRYNNDGTQQTTYADPARALFDQIGGLVDQGKARRAEKRRMDDAALSAALVQTDQNGGFLPVDVRDALSAQLGMKIAGANYDQNGNFIIYEDRAVTDPRTGRVLRNELAPTAIASPEMQMQLLQRSGLGGGLAQRIYDKMAQRLTPQQLADRGIYSPAEQKSKVDGKLALDAQKSAWDQSNKNVAAAQKQLELLQKRRDALAQGDFNPANKDDPRVKQIDDIDRQIRAINVYVGSSIMGGSDPWLKMIGGGEQDEQNKDPLAGDTSKGGAPGSGGKATRAGTQVQTARTFKPGDVVNGRRWTGSGWEKVKKDDKNQPQPRNPQGSTQPPPEEGTEADLVAKESARRRAFTGELEQDEDGSVRYKIRNWDYLPKELKDKMPERGEDLDDLALDAQNKADAAKKEFEERFNSEVKPSIEEEARRKFPNNAAKRRVFVEEEVRKWRETNDPAEIREEKMRKELATSTRLR